METKLSRLHGVLAPFLAWVMFAGAFFALTQLMPPDTATIVSSRVLDVFNKYARYAGIAIGLVAFLEMLILMGLAALLGILKNRFAMPAIVTLEFSGWAAFGYYLVFVEPRYADVAKAIIVFIGEPLMFGAAIILAIGLLWLLSQFLTRKKS